MRIAVCRPQVPFAHGGAEIFSDTLVDELRTRGHEAEIVSVPFKWYPGTSVLTQAFTWRLLDLTEADGQSIDLVVATKFPSYVVRHPEKRVWLIHQFRQAYELDRTELGQFGESPEDRATAPQGAGARPGRARRGDPPLRHLAKRRRPARALDRARRRSAAPSRPGARLPRRRAGRLRPLGQPARPREADRPPHRCGRRRAVAAGRDRGRRARPASGSSSSARSAASTGASASRARVARRARRPLRDAASRPSTRRWTRTSASARTSRSSPSKPVITATDAGGPLEVVHDGATGRSSRPTPPRSGVRRCG